MKILVVSAHPDDEVIGIGGILKKLSKTNEISILFLADGITARKKAGHENVSKYDVNKQDEIQMKKEIEIRKKHAKNALRILGVNKMKFLDLPDNELDLVPFLKIVKEVEKEIINIEPNIIFTHHHNDLNVDHRIAFKSVITAARPLKDSKIKTLYSFESISSTDWNVPYKFRPNEFVDISNEINFKIKALKEYKNEIRDTPHPRSPEMLKAVAMRWGGLYGFKFAEALELIYDRNTFFENLK